MPVYGLPTALESSLNTLLTHKQPISWRVSSHGDDVTVVIRWPKQDPPSSQKLVHCKSAIEDSSGEDLPTSKHQRHMWSRQGTSVKRARKEIEPQGKTESSAKTKLESEGRRRDRETYPPSSSPVPSTPFPVYLTASGGHGSQSISYAYANEKVRGPLRQAIMPPSSTDVFSKSRRRLKDIGKSGSFSGKSSRASSPSPSSSSSSTSPSASASSTKDPRRASFARRRVKSESSFTKSSAVAMNENTESFYHTIARALTGYGEKRNASAAESPLWLASPVHTLTSGAVDGQSLDEDGTVVIQLETDNSVRGFRDSMTWDCLDVKDEEET